MKHPFALILTYKSLEGHEYTIDWLPRESAELCATSLESLNDSDVAGWLSPEQAATAQTLLSEGGADEALSIQIDESNYPLYVIANAGVSKVATAASTVQIAEGFSEMNTKAFNEGVMCDGGPSRKDTLKHAREAFRQIGSISEALSTFPTLMENFQARLSALEGNTVPQAATLTSATEETPATEATIETPAAEATPVTESVAPNADVPSEEADTPIAAVQVESPLDEEGNTPASQTATEEDPETVTETDPQTADPVLTLEARLSLRRLSVGRRNAGVTL